MFLNPLMLAGLGGAMLPVVLHLLARSRFRTVDWAAMMFLEGLEPRQRQSTRLKQLILLLFRMAIVGVLAVALARPVVSESLSAVATGGRVSAVIVIDGSASTTLVENGKPRAELIRQAAIQVLASLHKGDEAAVIVAGPAQKASPRKTTELSRVADEIGAIVPAGRANLADALSRAADLLDRPEDLNRRLYVITDRQAVNWKEVDAAFRTAWRTKQQREPIQTPLIIVPVGTTAADNLAVEAVTIANPPAVKDQPIDVDVRLRNYGQVRRAGVPVTVSLFGREMGRATVDCAPDSVVTARVSVKYWDTGPQLLTAAIAKTPGLNTGVTFDDSLDFALEIAEPTKVLILSGDERQPKSAAESYFAAIALQPFATSGRHGNDPAKVTVMPAESATASDLANHQVVILANVPTISPAMASSIEQWVYDGGGLMVAPGGVTRADVLADRLFRNGAGVLPCGLSEAVQAQSELGQLDLAHPTLQFLRGRAEAPPTTFSKWLKLAPLRTDARVIAQLANGDPFAVEGTAGRGRVMVLATPLDADWSTLPLTSFYLPFMQSSVRWLSGGTPDRNLPLGSLLTYTVTGEVKGAQLWLPDGTTANLTPQRQGDRTEFRYPDADQPGVYRMRVMTAKRDIVVPFVLTGPSDESNLSPLQQKDWEALARDLDATVVNTPRQTLAETLSTNRASREVWAALVLGVILLGLAETWLAGRWSRQD